MAAICISEFMCFVMNNFGKTPLKNIKDIVVNFYEAEEIVAAKELLHQELTKLSLDGLPRLLRRQGDNRSVRDMDDIMAYITRADEGGMLSSLPVFVAAKLDRLPTTKPSEMDLYALVCRMARLEEAVASHDTVMKQLPKSVINGNDAQQMVLSADNVSVDSPPQPPDHTSQSSSTWADVAADNGGDHASGWNVVNHQKHKSQPRLPVRVLGSKEVEQTSTAVRTVPRKSVLAAYVGRLHPETTEEDLTRFLTVEGMRGIVCKKLKAKNGQVFRTAAFYVTCGIESSNLFYNEQCWPEGVELRDWIYK